MNKNRLSDLVSDLDAADYREPRLAELWGPAAADALTRANRLPARRVLAAARIEPLATLAQLFLVGDAVGVDALAEALPRFGVEGAVDAGLVAVEGDRARARVDLRPYAFVDALGEQNWWLVSDLGEMVRGGALGEGHVVGIGGAGRTLAGLIIPEPMGLALDLGTGCGIQALHLARFAERVIATDISERALEMAAFNAALNGVENIEFRLGSLFEPVAGETFDRIVSNPPFVITPRMDGVPTYEYRDGGLEGDAIVAAMMTQAPRHLTPGGIAQMLGNWEYRGELDAFDRIRGWLDAGVDAWIVERERQDPVRYAETWIRDGGTVPGTAAFEELATAWLDDFEHRGVTGVGFGYVFLRRATGELPIWRRFERVDSRVVGGLGGHVAQVVAARDWQAARTDAELAAESLLVSGDVTEERHYWPGFEDPSVMILHQGAGFSRSVDLDTGLAAIVGASDGTLPAGVLVGAIAQLLEVDEAALAAELLPRLRELLDEGFLVPAEFNSAS